ncbi:MAG: hypothetical protein H7839_04480 [Magnetococcus sp. YQC-5]
METLNSGGGMSLVLDSTASQRERQVTSQQFLMLTPSEVESLRQDGKQARDRLHWLFDVNPDWKSWVQQN